MLVPYFTVLLFWTKLPVTHPPPTGTVVENLRMGYCILKRETQTNPDKPSLKPTKSQNKTKQEQPE